MADAKIFAGPRIRRLRMERGLTQTAMAEELAISPSYLNLIERNQRPLTAQLVLKLVSTYEIDVAALQPSGEGGSVAALKEVFVDPLLSGELPGDTELLEISEGAPNAAIGIVKLYRAYREQQERLSDLSRLMGEGGMVSGSSSPGETNRLPLDVVRSALEAQPWCFPALENAAARVASALDGQRGKMAALCHLLRADHGISVQVLPVETMPVWRKRFDRHSNRLLVSERLPRTERAELLAQELILRRESSIVDEEVDLLSIEGDEARRLARMELARYAALAVLMPYERMLRTAERVHYDPMILAGRFETNFAQVAHRLVSLQDKSAGRRAGLPFFAMEVDQSGTIMRRVGAKGFPLSRFGGHCPKLAVHAVFARPDEVVAERVANPDGDVYLTMARTVDGPLAGAGERPRRMAVLLGIEDTHAREVLQAASGASKRGAIIASGDVHTRMISHARLLPDPQLQSPIAIGPACRLCERQDCVARSAPPITRPLGLDDLVQGFGAYGLT
ncbi:MAG: short-chain fatty acyl-CoA regulator family protein [Ahrensia sp.]|nr:short-chain fatty acyl-CoA regulator family protein [Ahrensia sp.]